MSPPSPALIPPPVPDQTQWFAAEVQPHEPELRAYLTGKFPGTDVDDLIQESYAQLLRAQRRRPLTAVRPYLFTIARNAAYMIYRRRKIVTIEAVGDVEDLHLVGEGPDAAEALNHGQEIALMHEAIAALPPRSREVLRLRRLQDLSRQEIATRLGISENTVDAHICGAILRCRKFLLEHGVSRDGLASALARPLKD